jgi:hypothetical protein
VWVIVISVCSPGAGSSNTSTTLRTLGSAQVERDQLKLSRFGGSSTTYCPVTKKTVPYSSISSRSEPPTTGSACTFLQRAGRGHIQSARASGSSHSP